MSKNSSYSTKTINWNKRVQLCTCLFLLLIVGKGQNLVPNGGFENRVCCPDDHLGTQLECTVVWFDANPTSGTSDYFNLCTVPVFDPREFLGHDIWDSESGNGIAGFFNFSKGYDFSEYLEVKLIDSLRAGKVYQLSADLKASYPYYASDAVDFLFTRDTLKFSTWFLYGQHPQVSNPSGNIISDSIHWYTLVDTFKAQGGEQFLTIGSFRLGDSTHWVEGPYPGMLQAYAIIDNIKVTEYVAPSPEPIPEFPFNVYPNPSNGNFTVTYTLDTLLNHRLDFYNALGQIVYTHTLDPQLNRQDFSLSNLASGMYFYRLYSGNRKSNKGKIVIVK